MSKIFSSIFIIVAISLLFTNPTRAVLVEIINALPDNTNPLKLRCQSADNDLGYHTLLVNQNFSWSFHDAILGDTLYFCHFYWGEKERSMVVYDKVKMGRYCLNHKTDNCFWQVRADGFYFNNVLNDPNSWQRKVEW